MRLFFSTLLLLASPCRAHATAMTVFNEREQIFNNENCAASDSCTLKLFRLNTVSFRVTMRDGSQGYGTRMIACFETKEIKDLEQFGVAQFIKGCQYYSKIRAGRVAYEDYIVSDQSGRSVAYHHPDWIVDGFVLDPLDWGDRTQQSRQYYYWNRVPGWESGQSAGDVFGIAGPRGPLLCVRDHPGSAFADKTSAKNVSLQFRTCLYKANEVPRAITLDGLKSIAPLHCFDWSNSFVFDHGRKEYQSPAEIAPFCLK